MSIERKIRSIKKSALGLVAAPTMAYLLTGCSGSISLGPNTEPSRSAQATVPGADDIQAAVNKAIDKAIQDNAVRLQQQDIGQKGIPPGSSFPATASAAPGVNSRFCGDTESLALGNEVVPQLVAVTGIPGQIDSGPVEVADGTNFPFKNPLWRSIFSQKGGLWSEPGDQDIKAARAASGGGIQTFNPMQQEVIGTSEYCWNLDQGGFNVFTADRLSLEIERTGVRIDLEQKDPKHIHYIAIRGYYPDPKNGEDKNRQVHLFNYKAGFVQALRLDPLPGNQNVAFLSEGQLYQFISTMVGGKDSSRTNCGSADCSNATITLFDINTLALRVIGDVTAANNNGVLAYSNWNK